MLASRRRRRAAAAAAAAAAASATRPRVDRPAPASAPPALLSAAAALRNPAPPPPNSIPLRVVWREPAVQSPVVAASFDGWLHHRLSRSSHGLGFNGSESAPDLYATVLYVPKGVEVTYKFLVDGKWRTDAVAFPPPNHPVSLDGKVHVALPSVPAEDARFLGAPPQLLPHQEPSFDDKNSQDAATITSGAAVAPVAPVAPVPPAAPVAPVAPTAPVPPAAPAAPVPPVTSASKSTPVPAPASASKQIAGTPHDTASAYHASTHSTPSVGYAAAARRSVMMRVGGARWRAKLGVENGRGTHVPSSAPGLARQVPAPDRPLSAGSSPANSGLNVGSYSTSRPENAEDSEAGVAPVCASSSFFASDAAFTSLTKNDEDAETVKTAPVTGKENAQLMQVPNAQPWTPASIAPSPSQRQGATRAPGREPPRGRPTGTAGILRNSFRPGNSGPLPTTPTKGPGMSADRLLNLGRGPGRASSRSLQKVVVSGPTRVDEPDDASQVHRTAQNWRGMAQHLQNDLNDPVGARQLFQQAIDHLEKHGLWSTLENAQLHIDLARALSKANMLAETELNLRVALKIYEHVNAAAEHKGDLVHYIAVVVDRQKRRTEAEALYRQALDIYKDASLCGDNVKIALKNLALNLRKQNRGEEADRHLHLHRGDDGRPPLHGSAF